MFDTFIEGLGTKNKSTLFGAFKLSFIRPGQRQSKMTHLYGGFLETRSKLLFCGIFEILMDLMDEFDLI